MRRKWEEMRANGAGILMRRRVFGLGRANDVEDANLEVKAAPQVIP
jgi:hypothetical protein